MDATKAPDVPDTSTFHYGSIKITSARYRIPMRFVSTFHYGSIKIAFFYVDSDNFKISTFHYGSIKICSLI